MRKVFVAIPAHDWKPTMPTMLSVLQAQAEALGKGWQFEAHSISGDSDIARARNIMLGQFHAEDHTDLLYWDADVSCGPGTFPRLMEHAADVVCGIYRMKTDDGELYPVHWPNPRRMISDESSKRPLLAADLVPAGFLRLSRSAVMQLCQAVPADDWFTDPRFPGTQFPDVFEWSKDRVRRIRLSEDYTFCRKWQACGGTVYVDPMLRLDHTGMKTFEGDLYASLGREMQEHQRQKITGSTILERAKAAIG